jgi:uncharacterized protein with gpF-like domain
MREGLHPFAMARQFKDSIGLTSTQLGYLASYKRTLETGSADALSRALRDRRFDRLVENITDGVDVLTADQIKTMLARYHANLLAMRAEAIGRTEALRVTAQAQRNALDQSLAQVGIEASRVTKVWNATNDKRTRDTHSQMDGQEQPLNIPFKSPSGARLMMPGDSAAPASERINCRCTVSYVIKEAKG